MDRDELRAQLLATWRRHNEILLLLLSSIPKPGLCAIPLASKGRTVAEQFHHLDRVRRGWLQFHETGKRVKSARVEKGNPPSRARLRASLAESGRMVERFLVTSYGLTPSHESRPDPC
jgi:hypothetical protein